MAEIKVTDLPTITLDDFTENDRFLVIDDGKARQLTRGVFQQWLVSAVRGEKGDQGPAGKDGANGINGTTGQKGADGLSAYQIAVSQGFSGTQQSWLNSLKGSTGATGKSGNNGWTPSFKAVPRGSDVILEISDWVGGTGAKPDLVGFLGANGIVSNAINAVNIRGDKGEKGDEGPIGKTGERGTDGVDGKTVTKLTYGEANTLTLHFNDETTLDSDSPAKVTGFGSYKDGKYLDSNPLVISTNSQEILPNNATTKFERLPDGVTSFYNVETQKYTLEDINGIYSVRVRFKISPNASSGFMNVSFSKGTTDLSYSHDIMLRGDNKVQEVDLTTLISGNTATVSNGISIRVKSFERLISLYNIEVTVVKVL